MSNSQTQIGLIIPSYNDQRFLEPLFESLYDHPAGASFWPVIVNDHSTDGTAEWIVSHLDGYASAVTPVEKCFFTRACNVGLRWMYENVRPKYYMLFNSDLTVTDNWAISMIGTGVAHNAGILGVTLLNPDGTLQHYGAFSYGQHYDINKPRVRRFLDYPVPWVTGAALAIREDVLETQGNLPVGSPGVQYDGSDRAYCESAWHSGYEVWVSGGATMYHHTHVAERYRRDHHHLTAKEQEWADRNRGMIRGAK